MSTPRCKQVNEAKPKLANRGESIEKKKREKGLKEFSRAGVVVLLANNNNSIKRGGDNKQMSAKKKSIITRWKMEKKKRRKTRPKEN